ncbi:MAG: hypothetical protein ACK5SU_01315, partial [Phenylobacterium sp.]
FQPVTGVNREGRMQGHGHQRSSSRSRSAIFVSSIQMKVSRQFFVTVIARRHLFRSLCALLPEAESFGL